jgi:aspartyl protease family protein
MAGYLRTFLHLMATILIGLALLKPVYPASRPPESPPGEMLSDALEKLSLEHGIRIQGLAKTKLIPARPSQGDLREQLRQLLYDFNYAVIHSPEGGVERLLILGQKQAAPDPPEHIVLNTGRSGDHHVIQTKIHGPSGASAEVSLLVDTGASFVVLPASLIAQLELTPGELEDSAIQTANGRVDAKRGQLGSLQLGPEILRQVEAVFIEDSLLGAHGLLGMNVLGRYLMTIDDEKNRISLIKQH